MDADPTPAQTAADDQQRAHDRTVVRALTELLRNHRRNCREVDCIGLDVPMTLLRARPDQLRALLAAALVELAGDDPAGEPDLALIMRRP